MQISDHIIRTKIRRPFTRLSQVPRPRLQERIAQGVQGPLTLVVAPAGFGKTTLVASSVADCGLPVAWLSLDMHDNQEGRFLPYVIAALQETDNTIGGEAAQLMAAMQQAPPEVILTSLINDLDAAHGETALVLDDYQFISSQAVHDEVAFLLDHCPHTVHIVIATRSDPPLPLARLRARGQAVELRAADLSFTEAEAAQFLNEIMGLCLDIGSVATLAERTEGWIAGLQMVALSMRDRKDMSRFIEGFSGTNRYILDYLLEEVLASQPPEIQHFLLYTSILERLTAPLCDTLLKDHTGERSSAILDYLERASLFLVPLDDERTWYRYHHLFGDLLRAQLDQIYPGQSRRLHALAAAWLEQEGLTVEAVKHNLAAREFDRAARLVEENTTHLLAQGELNALMNWMELLPEELRPARPWLCVHQATALMFAGRTAEVESLLTQAEAALGVESAQATLFPNGQADKMDPLPMGMAEAQALKGAVAALRAFKAAILVQDAQALSQAQQARELLGAGDLFSRSLVAWALGYVLHGQGHLAEARSAFEEQIRLGGAMQNNATLMIGVTALARVLGDQGKLNQARALLEEALAEARQRSIRHMGFIARMEAHLAGVLYEQNDLEGAHRLLSDGLAHARFWLNPNHLTFIYVYLARVLLAKGELEAARIAIDEADQIRRKAKLSPWLRGSLETEIVWTWLALQSASMSLDPSDPLAEQSRLILASWRSDLVGRAENQDAQMDQRVEMVFLTLARVSLASGCNEEALTLLEPVTRSARAAGHTAVAIGSLILTSLAAQSKPAGRMAPALTAVEEALALAEPGGYVRVFLNEGQSMQMLLAQWLAHTGVSPLRGYAIQLLSQFDAEPHQVTAAREKIRPIGNLIEPLSQRELEVLHLIALGKTNHEIAERLIVAAGTVKAHAASIYRKLEAANRTEAVNRARQLGILP